MMMKELVADFTGQLKEALKIAQNAKITPLDKKIDNVVVTGLGGSGIGGTILTDWCKETCPVPIVTNKDYHLPGFAGENTLVVVSSYSGNTEETIQTAKEALKKGATVVAVTSGGELQKMAQKHGFDVIVVPGGNPPRGMLVYSLIQLLAYFNAFGLFKIDLEQTVDEITDLVNEHESEIQNQAREAAHFLYQSSPYIYTVEGYAGLGVRTRQQINENAKMLCNAHVIPEMNHNELVGWAGHPKDIAVLIFRNEDEDSRNIKRVEINEEIMRRYTNKILQVHSKGSNRVVRTFYHIHFGDWLSIYLAELNNVDPVEIEVINYLKGELSKFS